MSLLTGVGGKRRKGNVERGECKKKQMKKRKYRK